jgi:oligopeptidase B
MMQYSPYDNIEKKAYPAMLYNSGISDEQVTYWEPAKMVAKLREYKTDNNLLLLHIKMHAGHAGASKRYEAIRDKAFNYAFVLERF